MASVITISNQFRSEVLRRDRDALRQLSSAYSEIARRLRIDLDALTRDIEQAQRAGKTVNRDWLRRSLRYQSLIRQAQIEIRNYSSGVLRFIEAQQRSAIDLGQDHAAELIQRGADITFARLPLEAIQEMVGVLEDGSPLSKVLDRLGKDAAGQIRNNLIAGLGQGHSVQRIARQIRSDIDMPRWNALRLARNEILRSYRTSTLRTYQENSDVLESWTWISARNSRTCYVCWGLHGKVFPLSVTFFPNHVACRCTSIPNPKGSPANVQAGSVLFAELPSAQQQSILGPTRYQMWTNGEVGSLMDFAILTRDKEWGQAYVSRPLHRMKTRKAA